MDLRGARVLIVDDDAVVAESLAAFVTREGGRAVTASRAERALKLLEESAGGVRPDPFGIVVCDIALPGRHGLELVREIRGAHPDASVIVLTGYGTVESAVEALRLGAVDFLTKPARERDVREALERGARKLALASEQAALRQRFAERGGLTDIVGKHYTMQRIYELVEAVAPSKTTVLMSGESGTGKSKIARAIHDLSPRRAKPMVELSCGSIPESLLESELFGHVKGAFTGAHADKAGRFLAADGGTIFLDEINSASPAMQLKLLRVLQERTFEPVGSSEPISVDVRVVLASNQPLEELVASGAFRQDLYYRINVVRIEVPSLRERPSDIPLLAEHFLARLSREAGTTIVGFTREATEALRRYPFPGNVRELENVVERAVIVARGQTITLDDLPPEVVRGEVPRLLLAQEEEAYDGGTLSDALRGPERSIILSALRANEWNRQKTADQLGINRTTLYKKMKSLGLDGEDGRLAG